MIIGQNNLKQTFDELATNNSIPQFSIITGPAGGGKKLLAEYLASLIKADTVTVILPKMESIQNMITTAKSASGKIVFLILDADQMSTQAKNATLKLFEEPPKDMYFIMTVSDLGMVLTTTLSRAMLFNIEPYSSLDIVRYTQSKNDRLDVDTMRLITSVCEVPGEVDILLNMNPAEFYKFVNKVTDTIAIVPGANAFKIADKLNLKDDADKYDVKLFLKTFMTICLDKCHKETLKYLNAVTTTSEYIAELNVSGANKQMIIDEWILAIRKLWM